MKPGDLARQFAFMASGPSEGDEVKVVGGPHAGKKGQVEHVEPNGTLWVSLPGTGNRVMVRPSDVRVLRRGSW